MCHFLTDKYLIGIELLKKGRHIYKVTYFLQLFLFCVLKYVFWTKGDEQLLKIKYSLRSIDAALVQS